MYQAHIMKKKIILKSLNPRLISIIKTSKKIYDRINSDLIFTYAAQASFFTIISAIPFTMLLLTVLRYFIPVSESEITEFIGKYLPLPLIPLADTLTEEVFVKTNIPIISVSAMMLLWTASRGIKSIGQGIRGIYRTTEKSGFIKITVQSLIFTILFIVFMAISVSAILFGRILTGYLYIRFELSGIIWFGGDWLCTALRVIFIFLFLFVIVASCFKGLGRHEMHMRDQLPGAFFTASAWLIFAWGYTVYIDNFSNFSYIYGSLTAAVLLMLWLHSSMVILLLGAEINILLFCRKLSKKYTINYDPIP